ncbi:MAG: helix-turn-helix domain-containing protein [Alphaproteobacteria bacterium]
MQAELALAHEGWPAREGALDRLLARYGQLLDPFAPGLALAPGLVPAGKTDAVDRLGAVKPSTRRALLHRLERARSHLHAHLDRAIPLDELASVAGLSKFHLARYFRCVFDSPPAAYHRRLRLKRAAEFLAAGGGSVADAAELVGYSDGVALCHAFRKQFGEPPRDWSARIAN